MLLLDQIAETRIREAMERGEFDNLLGQGQPLSLDDDRQVPESFAAYRSGSAASRPLQPIARLRSLKDAHEIAIIE